MNPFLERYTQLGESFEPKSISIKQALRVNTLKIADKELIARLNARLEKITYLEHGYTFESDFTVGAMPEHFLGMIYIQEGASQISAEILDPKPGELVLDMCAAPGSKTTQMAAMMGNKGEIIALDANNPRLPSIKNNLERCGVRNCLLYKKDAVYVEDLRLEFDKILLDAPCSGNFALEKDWFEKRDIAGINENAKMQLRLLESAIAVLKKGGTLVYSTCSLEPEENEMNINWLLNKYSNIKLEKIEKKIGDPGMTDVFGQKLREEIKLCRRLWPHKTGTQGFFLAKLSKKI
jgi:tRNA (cytosine40_48-C5)-methyltransferase